MMKQAKLQDMTVDELLERFTAIALDQDRALLRNEYAKFNRLFKQMEEVKRELKARDAINDRHCFASTTIPTVAPCGRLWRRRPWPRSMRRAG